MYSFEKRPSASAVCVRPAAMRSARRRSPRRAPPGVEVVAVSLMPIGVNLPPAPAALPPEGDVVRRVRSSKRTRNHLTELLDFSGPGSYSQAHTAVDRTPDRLRGHLRRIRRRAIGRAWLGRRATILRPVAPGRRGRLERRTPPEPQPGAFSRPASA